MLIRAIHETKLFKREDPHYFTQECRGGYVTENCEGDLLKIL